MVRRKKDPRKEAMRKLMGDFLIILTKNASAPVRIGLNVALGLGTIACADGTELLT